MFDAAGGIVTEASVDEAAQERERGSNWLARDEVRVEVGRESVFLLDN